MWTTVYKPELLDIMIAHARNGASIVERCVEMGISRATYYNWIDSSSEWYIPEFAEAAAIADALSETWWARKGQQHLTYEHEGVRMDANIYRLQMMNRFGWSESNKTDLNASGDIVINLSKRSDANGDGND